MKKKKIIIVIILIIILLSIGVSYAYFSLNIKGNSKNKNANIKMNNISLSFNDNSNDINDSDLRPGWIYQKKVTVTNTGDVPVTYDLVWKELENEIEKDEMVYSIECLNCNKEEQVVPFGIYENKLITTNTINKEERQEYIINFKFKEKDENQNYNENKIFKGIFGIKVNGEYNEVEKATLDNWEYNINEDNKTVILTRYSGNDVNVDIFPKYYYNGKSYKTVIDSGNNINSDFLFYDTNTIWNKTIESINFIDNVEFLNNKMDFLFAHCRALKKVNLSKLKTNNIKSMQFMFYECYSLTKLDLSSFTFKNNLNYGHMFPEIIKDNNIYVSEDNKTFFETNFSFLNNLIIK